MANRLADATSPYLAQHAENPVHWWPWCDEAFAQARARNVPVLLSVGYAACHWCHVMAHESFEDTQVADVLNAGFVAIKVDREERPDIDAIYMSATTAMTGHGGWPMTCLLTPSGEPFFTGTYFPKQGFLQLLGAVTEAWTERQDEVLAAGSRIADALRSAVAVAGPAALGAEELLRAEVALARGYDTHNGGFGDAPKFPPSMVLEFLLRHKDSVVTKTEILRGVWDAHYEGADNVVEVYIGYLRKKLDQPFGSALIETVRGAGYRLADESSDAPGEGHASPRG